MAGGREPKADAKKEEAQFAPPLRQQCVRLELENEFQSQRNRADTAAEERGGLQEVRIVSQHITLSAEGSGDSCNAEDVAVA